MYTLAVQPNNEAPFFLVLNNRNGCIDSCMEIHVSQCSIIPSPLVDGVAMFLKNVLFVEIVNANLSILPLAETQIPLAYTPTSLPFLKFTAAKGVNNTASKMGEPAPPLHKIPSMCSF